MYGGATVRATCRNDSLEHCARRIRVMIVDDQPATREALCLRISRLADMEVAGEAANVTEALNILKDTGPDTAIVSVHLSGGDGLELIKRFKAHNDRVRIVALSTLSEWFYAQRALRAGAMAYVTKDQKVDCVIEALREILAGKTYLSANVADNRSKATFLVEGEPLQPSPLESLSDRELEVFRLVGEGWTDREVASRLHLSPKTVATYRDRIRQKLGLRDRRELLRCAIHWATEIN